MTIPFLACAFHRTVAKRLCRVFRFSWVVVLRYSLFKTEHDMTKHLDQRIASHRVWFKD